MKPMNPLKFFVKKKPASESARHARLAAVKRFSRKPLTASKLVLAATLIFLFLPLFSVALHSFNAGKSGEWAGFSLVWYKKLFFDSGDLWAAFGNSLVVAVLASLTATVLGSFAALGVSWYKFRGRDYINVVSLLPMILPEVIVGVSTLLFFCSLKIRLGLFTIFVAHTTFCLPFVFLLVLARLDEFDFSIVEAAYDLGATESQTLLRVVFPALAPGIFASFLMSITISLEDFVITFFVSGPGSTTLPLYVYSMIRFGVSPVINALSCIMILCTMIFAFLGRNFLKTFAASK